MGCFLHHSSNSYKDLSHLQQQLLLQTPTRFLSFHVEFIKIGSLLLTKMKTNKENPKQINNIEQLTLMKKLCIPLPSQNTPHSLTVLKIKGITELQIIIMPLSRQTPECWNMKICIYQKKSSRKNCWISRTPQIFGFPNLSKLSGKILWEISHFEAVFICCHTIK